MESSTMMSDVRPFTLIPRAPKSPEETGLSLLSLSELTLKVMLQHALTHLAELSQHMRLPASVLESVFLALRKDNLVEVRRRGQTDGDVIYDLTNAGRSRAAEALARNLYTGPAPVPLRDYIAQVQRQSVFSMGVT